MGNVLEDTHPILSCSDSSHWETKVLGSSERKQWAAMNRAGQALGRAIISDYQELRPTLTHILILAGKGHNAGDAMIAAGELSRLYPKARLHLLLVQGSTSLKPLTHKALENLQAQAKTRLHIEDMSQWSHEGPLAPARLMERVNKEGYDVCIDGILGMRFRPPVREPIASLLTAVNTAGPIGLRAAVDLPSGIGDLSDQACCFRADITYATGIAKAPLFEAANVRATGRIRYLNIDFFAQARPESDYAIVVPTILKPLQTLRPAHSDKRSFGHLFVLGGSRPLSGALLMSVQAALCSGVGCVTAFAPESVAAAFAAALPEAMWIPWPETPQGSLALKGKSLLESKLSRATALLIGPGMGTEHEPQSLATECVKRLSLPLVLDADALYPQIVAAVTQRPDGAGPVVMTPHRGEFCRLAGLKGPPTSAHLRDFCRQVPSITVLKGPITRIQSSSTNEQLYASFGGPVLARGGSGDLLCGLIAGLLAQGNTSALAAACRGVTWHGLAAAYLARQRGAVAIRTTEILKYLPFVLRESYF